MNESDEPADNSAGQTVVSDKISSNEWPFPKSKDWLLARIVSLTTFGVEQGVTLTVGGSFITGILINGVTYLEEMAAEAERATTSGGSNTDIIRVIADMYRSYKAVYERPDDAPEDWVAPPPNYIHLRNARLVSATGFIPSRRGLLWRAHLKDVQAFAVGQMQQD